MQFSKTERHAAIAIALFLAPYVIGPVLPAVGVLPKTPQPSDYWLIGSINAALRVLSHSGFAYWIYADSKSLVFSFLGIILGPMGLALYFLAAKHRQ